MFHNRQSKLLVTVVMALLVASVLAPVTSAQEPPPPEPPPDTTPESSPPTDPPSPPTDPPSPPTDPPSPPTDPPPPDNGNGDMMMKSPSTWPPPNAIVRHAATPIQISALPGGLSVYFIDSSGAGKSGPVLPFVSDLAKMHAMGGAVELYNGLSPGTGKSVTIHYLPDSMKIRVSTYYADRPPHDYNKPYVFTVDADHTVTHESW